MKKCEQCGLTSVVLQVTNFDGSMEQNPITEPVDIDACIAPIIQALNQAGIPTAESCCGHGKRDPTIWLQDGRVLSIKKR